MFSIVIAGKAGSVSVRFANATEALHKYREMEADGSVNIEVHDAKGERVGAFDLEQLAKEDEATEQAGQL